VTIIKAFQLERDIQYSLLSPIKTEGQDFPVGARVINGVFDDGSCDMPRLVRINGVAISPGLTLNVEIVKPEVKQ